MSDIQKLAALGLLLNSALYVIGLFVAGIVLKNDLAWKMALTTAGLCYFAYAFHLAEFPKALAGTTVAGSVIAGVIGALALLFGS